MAAIVEAPKSLSNLFFPPGTDKCQRCNERVYQVEKIGPVNEVVFHKQCFKCAVCGQHLTVKTYYTNQLEFGDKEIYCWTHIPKTALLGYDARAIGIQNALHRPNTTKPFNAQILPTGHAPLIGNEAIAITHPVNAQNQFQSKYKQSNDRHHYPAFVAKKKSKIIKAQTELEKVQRKEEDVLMEVFRAERTEEKKKIDKEIDEEWEERLKELTANFDADMEKRTTGHKAKDDDKKARSVKYAQKKNQLKENMTVKLKQKQEAITLRLRKKEQEDTAVMVQKHSEQMLNLLKEKQQEIRQEIVDEMKDVADGDGEAVDTAVILEEVTIVPIELPEFHPPNCRKRDLYYDAAVFKDLDEYVFSVAEKEQSTFTDLVAELTQNCVSDLEKARAIFRWITVKDLNVLEFEEGLEKDTPMGLLRGIKYGTETYHTLFMRLCSYAGLPCVEIKGHSKSVGYEPGMKIRQDTFQNTWNGVLIGGNWWPVQCNWGARHLVLNKDAQEKLVKTKKQDKIRYQYDEHYFLTDPDEFIREFWAADDDKQLLEKPVTIEQFEQMPFVRSVFFHYGLEFDRTMRAVLYADNKGGTEVKVNVPTEYAKDLVFHYQIRFADRERRNDTEFRGAKLERFVFHSLVESQALFSVHVPAPSSYFLEVFANRIDETNKIGDDPNATMMPFRLKCACKFKIVCEEMVGKMHPLPNCASGEWGPSKGERHFGLKAMTHITGVVSVDNDLEMKFGLPRKLHFLCKLRMNGVEDSTLEKFVNFSVYDYVLTVKVNPPQAGQYGLDIYARPEDAADNHTLAHACKYLLNVTRVNDVINVPVSKVESSSRMSKDKWGPNELFQQIGMRAVSHTDPTINKTDTGALVIEMGMSETVKLSYNLTREPDEDCRSVVSMKDHGKKVKFSLSLAKPGNYLFAVYARKKKDSDRNMANVYNYMIKYAPVEKQSTLKKKKGLFSKK